MKLNLRNYELRRNIARLNPDSKQAEWERDELKDLERRLGEKPSSNRQ